MSEHIDPAIEAKLRQSFARQRLMTTFGAEITRIAPGLVEVSAPILDLARQQHGFGHAALSFALADTAAGYAALSLMPASAEVLTAEAKINLVAPAAGDRLVATGRVVKAGQRLTIVTSEVEAEAGGRRRLVALLQGTMVPVGAD